MTSTLKGVRGRGEGEEGEMSGGGVIGLWGGGGLESVLDFQSLFFY